MATPLTTNHLGRAADQSSLNALLPIGPGDRASIRILVVDDEHTLRESCASVLGVEGYDVTVCGRGEEALGLLKRRPFDIVLVDLFMSQVDGLALLRAALGTNADTIVIVMTGNPSVETSIDALRQGAWDYLPKPFSAQHLQIMIGRAAHSAARIREVRAPERRVHRRGPRQPGPARDRQRRDVAAGRADRDAEADPGEAAARDPGRHRAPGGERDDRRRRERAFHRRDERRP